MKIKLVVDGGKTIDSLILASANHSPVKLKGLRPSTTYQIQIASVNACGYSAYTELSKPITTPRLLKVPSDLEVKAENEAAANETQSMKQPAPPAAKVTMRGCHLIRSHYIHHIHTNVYREKS